MTRLAKTFTTLKKTQRKALIPYLMAGDPNIEYTLTLMHEAVRAGADIVELGIPFSDPMADGPVIQGAAERALAVGMSLPKVLHVLSRFRQQDNDTPVVLMGYLNPIESMGYSKFAEAAEQAGVDGVLIVDMPPEESAELAAELSARKIDLIYLLAPTSGPDRMKMICQAASGYLYYVSLRGVTGAGHLDAEETAQQIKTIKGFTKLPVGVGFGISDAASALSVGAEADAVIIGSAIVSRIQANLTDQSSGVASVFKLLKSIRQALDETAQAAEASA